MKRRRWENNTKHFLGGTNKNNSRTGYSGHLFYHCHDHRAAMRYPDRCSLSVQLNYHAMGEIKKDSVYGAGLGSWTSYHQDCTFRICYQTDSFVCVCFIML